jgi:hypothetical protein
MSEVLDQRVDTHLREFRSVRPVLKNSFMTSQDRLTPLSYKLRNKVHKIMSVQQPLKFHEHYNNDYH